MAASKNRSSTTDNWIFPALECKATGGAVAADVVFVSQDASKKPVLPSKHAYAATLDKLKSTEAFSARVGRPSWFVLAERDRPKASFSWASARPRI